jgi:hypothetical protein
MNFKYALIALPLLVFGTDVTLADQVSIKGHNHDKVQGKCGGDGDVYWVEGKTGHTYGCMHPDGSGIVCGGVTKEQKKTCDTFRLAPRQFPIPTREEAGKVDSH